MYKVLIIDDEVLVRVGLKTTIDWQKIGFIVVADASDGEQGYAQYKKHQPDVIITDIKMPKENGLSMIEKIRKENKKVIILVLTVYDDFSYARKALKLGADDYILKSEVEDEKLIELMTGIKEKIDKKNIAKTKKTEITRDSLKRSLFNDMLKNNFNINSKIKKQCKELDFAVSNTVFGLVSIIMNDVLVQEKREKENLQKVNNAIANIIFDQLSSKNINFIYNNESNDYTLLLSSPRLNKNKLNNILNSISNASQQYFGVFVKIFHTNLFENIEAISSRYKFLIEKTNILFYKSFQKTFIKESSEIKFNRLNIFDLKKQYNQKFINFIGEKNLERIEILNKKVKTFFKDNNIEPMIVKIFYSNLIADIFDNYEVVFKDNKKIKHFEYYHYRVMQFKDLDSVIELFYDLITEVIVEIDNCRYDNSKFIVSRALNYIQSNYDKQISLENIADGLHMSKNYLCNIFKEETGENTSLYINKVKIEKAKKMLLKKDYRIKELYEKVGFSNQYYFSKVFKKITGMTVTEYKKKNNL